MSRSEQWQAIQLCSLDQRQNLADLASICDPEQILIGSDQVCLSIQDRLMALQASKKPDALQAEHWLCHTQNQCLAWVTLHKQPTQIGILSLALQPGQEQLWAQIWANLAQQIAVADWRIQQPGQFTALFLQMGWIAGFAQQEQATGEETLYWLDQAQVLTPTFRFPAPPIQTVTLPSQTRPSQSERNPQAFRLDVLRLDQIHPLIKGNKWFKLHGHLIQARAAGLKALLTLGGAYSNHVLACAAAGALLGFQVKVLIRGERQAPLNPLLECVQNLGAEISYCSRSDFRHYRSASGQSHLQQQFPEHWLIPEGGSDAWGRQGSQAIWDYIPATYQQIACASGTASTLAGLIQGLPASRRASTHLLGVAVLKGADFLIDDLKQWLQPADLTTQWQMETRFHGRGYAKTNPELRAFISAFQALNPDLPIEHVYTAKLFWALDNRYQNGALSPDQPVLALHTGGVYPWTLTESGA